MESQDSMAVTSVTSVDDEEIGIDGLPMYLVLPDTNDGGICQDEAQSS